MSLFRVRSRGRQKRNKREDREDKEDKEICEEKLTKKGHHNGGEYRGKESGGKIGNRTENRFETNCSSSIGRDRPLPEGAFAQHGERGAPRTKCRITAWAPVLDQSCLSWCGLCCWRRTGSRRETGSLMKKSIPWHGQLPALAEITEKRRSGNRCGPSQKKGTRKTNKKLTSRNRTTFVHPRADFDRRVNRVSPGRLLSGPG